MQRTNVIQLKPNKFQVKILKEMMYLSSCVYNITNYEVRQRIINKELVPNFFNLQKMLQSKDDYKMLGRSYGLPRIQLYSETNSARFKLIKSKSQKRVGLPKYLKNRKTNTTIPSYLVIDGSQYNIDKNKVRIPISHQMRKKYHTKDFKIKYNGILRWQGKQCRSQIKFKNNKYYLYQSVEVKDVELKSSTNYASIDLGIKRLFALKMSNNTDYIIGSNRHYKQWCYYNQLIAIEQNKLSKINRYSSNNLLKLYDMRTKFQTNLLNNLIAKLSRVLKRNNISTVFVGDVKGIREQDIKNVKLNGMLNNYWAYDIIYHKLENKMEELGIILIKQEESNTSKTCPVCGNCDTSNKKDRLFMCTFCDYFDDRDVVGATNILLRGMHDHDTFKSVHLCEIAHLGGITYAN